MVHTSSCMGVQRTKVSLISLPYAKVIRVQSVSGA